MAKRKATQKAKGKTKGELTPEQQYALLKRCADARDMTKWNEWVQGLGPRVSPMLANADLRDADLRDAELWGTNLSGARLTGANLRNANLGAANLSGAMASKADLSGSNLGSANLSRVILWNADLSSANLQRANLCAAQLQDASLRGADLRNADLRHADCAGVAVNGRTWITRCVVDRVTSLRRAALDMADADSRLLQLLKYGIRRREWSRWRRAPGRRWWGWAVGLFWWVSDYGHSMGRIAAVFSGLAVAFALAFWACPGCLVVAGGGGIRGFYHALYFSVVTMTTLGFGDIHAHPDSPLGQTVLMLEVLLGYVLLSALITRLAILFQSEAPSASFYQRRETGLKGETRPMGRRQLFTRWLLRETYPFRWAFRRLWRLFH